MIGADAQSAIKNSVSFINLHSNMESSYSHEVIFIWKTWPLLPCFLWGFWYLLYRDCPLLSQNWKPDAFWETPPVWNFWLVFCSFDALLVYNIQRLPFVYIKATICMQPSDSGCDSKNRSGRVVVTSVLLCVPVLSKGYMRFASLGLQDLVLYQG